ncbi:MAG: hypothetical protein ACREFE_09775 [Limisphaerales bacterium]
MTLKKTQSDPLAQFREQSKLAGQLLSTIKEQLPKLEELLAQVESHWEIEDGFYRFYHQSFKVYHVQKTTKQICSVLQNLLPGRQMNEWFCKIIADGTGHEFEMSHNRDWLLHTRPILEAFFHAHFFLKMAVKYGRELQSAPDRLPSGWAAVLYLFNLR